MADSKISNLTALTEAAAADAFPIVDDSATETKKIAFSNLVGGASKTELSYLVGVTSLIQTQINEKEPTVNWANVSITGGTITGITDLTIADGGTGQSTQQAAINALTNVAAATNEHILTKDTTTGNAIFKVAPSGGFSSRVRAYLSAAQSIAASTDVKVTLDTENFDGLGEFDPVTNYRFTAQAAGYYLIAACTGWASSSTTKVYQTEIFKNGGVLSVAGVMGNGVTVNVYAVNVVYLAANDYIELYVWHNEASARNLGYGSEQTWMAIHKLSE